MVSGCGFPPCCPVAVAACWAGGRGSEVACPHPSLHCVGREGWVPGRWGQAPDATLLSLCTPHVGAGAWFRAELPPLSLQGPGALYAERLGACYLHPGAFESPKQVLTHTKPLRGWQHWSWGHCVGMRPAWGKANGTGEKAGGGDEGCCTTGCVSEAPPLSPGPAAAGLTPPARC